MNHSLRVLIADDEELARRLIREYLRSHPDIVVISECETGTEAVDAIFAHQPDLIFLDIQMPELTGLEVLDATGRKSGIIFTTAYDQYAVKAFDLHAIDYLLKPFSQQRFDEALQKAKKLLQEDKAADSSPIGIQQLITSNVQQSQRLTIRDREKVHVLTFEEIDFIEAQDDYILIHANGRTVMKTQSLSDIEEQLSSTGFVRVHRSYLLQMKALTGIERQSKDTQVAVLRSGIKIPVSRTGYERLKTRLN
ncbi:response regulator transcription factor [Undibacterium sp. FT147W]|uniref:Response regulator transcription factor n=1 Tax=Undibacterium rivi TaxID=2828729 RepID=A0ABS5H5D9_9BURK|nr:LytTR family DNA-binding domain-containing protein [Undibacterium rivi]MBR7793309.1 response regulator transcription factor [Undibacterium rivi]